MRQHAAVSCPQNMSLSVCRTKYARTYLEGPVHPGFPVVLLDQFHLLKICQLPIRITPFFAILFLYVLVALFSKHFWSCNLLPTRKKSKATTVKRENSNAERNLQQNLLALLNELNIFSKTVNFMKIPETFCRFPYR